MATRLYTTRIKIALDQVGSPDYRIWLDGQAVSADFSIDLPAGQHQLEIEHYNKDPHDIDTALIVKAITFNDISSQRFVWAGVYRPDYPEPWASQQRSQGIELAKELPANNYLGWNGRWQLVFTAPIFTWIHKTENLGWIYS